MTHQDLTNKFAQQEVRLHKLHDANVVTRGDADQRILNLQSKIRIAARRREAAFENPHFGLLKTYCPFCDGEPMLRPPHPEKQNQVCTACSGNFIVNRYVDTGEAKNKVYYVPFIPQEWQNELDALNALIEQQDISKATKRPETRDSKPAEIVSDACRDAPPLIPEKEPKVFPLVPTQRFSSEKPNVANTVKVPDDLNVPPGQQEITKKAIEEFANQGNPPPARFHGGVMTADSEIEPSQRYNVPSEHPINPTDMWDGGSKEPLSDHYLNAKKLFDRAYEQIPDKCDEAPAYNVVINTAAYSMTAEMIVETEELWHPKKLTADDVCKGLDQLASVFKKQIGGKHYKDLAIQPVEYIQKNKLGFCEGNAIKYLTRHAKKGGGEDLKKAIHFIELLIEMEYPESSKG